MSGDFALWVFLSRTPLLWLTVTLTAYVVADRVSAATGRHPWRTRCCTRSGWSAWC